MAKIAHELLADLDKDTVEFGLNDESGREPLVLPTKVPHLSSMARRVSRSVWRPTSPCITSMKRSRPASRSSTGLRSAPSS